MTRISKIALFLAIGFGVSQYISYKYLAPIEQRVDAMTKAVEAAGIPKEPVDIEKVCGAYTDSLTPEALEKLNACYMAETQKQLDQVNTVLKAGNLPTLGSKDPCGPDMFQMVGDNNAGSDLMNALFSKKTAEAHALLSADMRAKISEAELTDYIDKMFWRGKTIAGAQGLGSGSTSGNFTCEGKTIIPVTRYEFTLNDEVAVKADIEAIQENGAWKIRSLKRIDGSDTQDPSKAPLPDAKRLSELVSGVMHAFIVDTSGSKIDLLYSGTSMYQRSQVSRSALETKFQPHFGKYEFKAIEGKQATITTPPTAVVLDQGYPVFDVIGAQPTTSGPLRFKMKFAYDGNWSLANLDIMPGN